MIHYCRWCPEWVQYLPSDSTSVCSSAPSVSDLESELEQMAAASFIKSESLKDALSDTQRNQSDVDKENTALTDTPADAAVRLDVMPAELVKGEDLVDPDVEQLERQELDQLLMPPPACEGFGPRPTAASLGLTESIEECMKISKDDGRSVWSFGMLT